MRKVTKEAVMAFKSKTNYSNSNTTVKVTQTGVKMLLHGNCIAEEVNGELFITTCGWKTNTTKERLNALPDVSIRQNDHKWYLNGHEWDGKVIKVTA